MPRPTYCVASENLPITSGVSPVAEKEVSVHLYVFCDGVVRACSALTPPTQPANIQDRFLFHTADNARNEDISITAFPVSITAFPVLQHAVMA